MCTPTCLCPQALTGIAIVMAILVGNIEDHGPPDDQHLILLFPKKQYQLPRGQKKKIAIIAELKEAKVFHEAISPFNNPIWPVHKTLISWRLTIDCRQLSA